MTVKVIICHSHGRYVRLSVVKILVFRKHLNNNLKQMYSNYFKWTIDFDSRDYPAMVVEDDGTNYSVINYEYDGAGNKTLVSWAGVSKKIDYSRTNIPTWISLWGSGKANDDPRATRPLPVLENRILWAEFYRASDALGRPEIDIIPGRGRVYYSHDELSQVTDIQNLTAGQVSISRFQYGYNSVGDRIFMDKTYQADPAVRSDYGYDLLSQLISATNPAEVFSYDVVGNRFYDGQEQYDQANRLLADGRYQYEYDDNGNRKLRQDLATNEVREYSWSSEDRLMQVTIKSDGVTATRSVQYLYDGAGRRIRKTVNDLTIGTTTDDRRYHYDGNEVFFTLKTNSATADNLNLHGIGVDNPIAVIEDLNRDGYWDLGLEVLSYTKDGLGSVREILNPLNEVVQKYDYTSFGATTVVAGPGAPGGMMSSNTFAYTAREYDEDADLYYYRARWYDPVTGRFISSDPIGFAGGDTNLYRYVDSVGKAHNSTDTNLYAYTRNNPIRYTDPLGLQPIPLGTALALAELIAMVPEVILILHEAGVLDGTTHIDASQPSPFDQPNRSLTPDEQITQWGTQNACH